MEVDVSVIIPAYNRLWCLPRAVDSCRGTACRTQIVVVDDGSTDGTADWLKEQADVTAIRQHNQGQSWAANRGTAAAAGRYVRFLDSDDFLSPGGIDRQFEAAVKTGADLVYSRVDTFLERSKEVVENPETPMWDDFLAVQLGEGYGSHYLGMLFRRELIERVPRRPEFSYLDDRMLLLEIGLLNPKLACVPGCAGFWVKHDTQMHDRCAGMSFVILNWQHLNLYRQIIGQLSARGELTERRRKAACNVLWPLAHWIAKTHPEEACQVAEWVYRLDPAFEPPERGLLGTLYRRAGFRRTERLLRLRRSVVECFRRSPVPKHEFPV
jgi:glycosyltransferase involved in cell wall biosynthesis